MPLEEVFVDRDVLDRDETAAGFVLRDRVDERRGIPVAESFDRLGHIDGHGGGVYQMAEVVPVPGARHFSAAAAVNDAELKLRAAGSTTRS
jgi:hypothetical protein